MHTFLRVLMAAGLMVWPMVCDGEAQTFTSPPGSTRGLFGGDVAPNSARSSQQLAAWFDLGGGYDDNADTSEVPVGTNLDGYARTVAAGFRYWRGRTTRSLEATGRYFRNVEFAAGGAFDGGELNVTGNLATGQRGAVTLALHAANDSAQLFGAFGPDFGRPGDVIDDEIPVSDVSPPSGVADQRWFSLGGVVTGYRNWTPRQRTDVQYTQIRRRPIDGDGVYSATGQATLRHEWRVGPRTGVLFSYSYDRVGQEFGEVLDSPPIQSQTADAGFRYEYRLSPIRMVQFSLTAGATYVLPVSAPLARVPGNVEPTASAIATYTLTQRWALSANASRRVTVLAGIALEPFANDLVSVSVTGLIARRTTLVISGEISRGLALGLAPGSFDAQSAAVTLQYGFRHGGVFAGYSHYEHQLRDLLGSPDTIPLGFRRHSVRGGITLYLPLYGAF